MNKGSVLITGASSGIGEATALLLDKAGYRVFAGVRNEQAAEKLKSASSGKVTPLMLDITQKDQIDEAVGTISGHLGDQERLTGLVNNAGTVLPGPLEIVPLEDIRRQLEINVIGHIAVTQACLPLVARGKGRIINVGSTAAYFAAPFLGAYAASKFAMEAVTDTLRRELGPQGIRVSIIEPGYTETPIWDKGYDHVEQLLGRLPAETGSYYLAGYQSARKVLDQGRRTAIKPATVAHSILRALESSKPKRRYLVGYDTYLLAFGKCFLPDSLADWLVFRVMKGR